MRSVRHDEDLVQLVVDALAAQARQTPTGRDPYSWGVRRLVAPSNRDVAVAVLDALAASGRLTTARRLRQLGIRCLTTGYLQCMAIAGVMVAAGWPMPVALVLGLVSGVVGSRLVNRWVAREMAGTGQAARVRCPYCQGPVAGLLSGCPKPACRSAEIADDQRQARREDV